MMRIPGSWTLLVVLSFVFAGCFSGPDAKPEGDDEPPLVAPTGEQDEDTCAMEGFVLDDEFLPLEGADVGLVGTDPPVNTTTALNGQFSFSFLPPKEYVVMATKAGYEAATKNVDCPAGQKVMVDAISLPQIPDPAAPHVERFQPEAGYIGCSIGSFTSTNDLCKDINPNSRNLIGYRPHRQPNRITGAVYELEWQPSGTFGGQVLVLAFPGPIHDPAAVYTTEDSFDPTGYSIRGDSPLRIKITTGTPDEFLYVLAEKSEGEFYFNVRAAAATSMTANDGSGLVYEQPFSLNVAYFHNGEPIPDGFTMLG